MRTWQGGRALWLGTISLVFSFSIATGTLVVKPLAASRAPSIELTRFPLLSQKDPANYRDGSYLKLLDTIPGSTKRELVPNLACLAAVYAMIARGRGERSATIDTFYPDPRASGGSTSGAIRPPYVGGDQPIDVGRIKESLQRGQPVILHGYGPPLGHHFVLVVGVKADSRGRMQLIALDPFPGKYQNRPGKRLAIRVLRPGRPLKHPRLPVTFKAMRLVAAGASPAVIAEAPRQPTARVVPPSLARPQPMFAPPSLAPPLPGAAPPLPMPGALPPANLDAPVQPRPSETARLPGSPVTTPPPRAAVSPAPSGDQTGLAQRLAGPNRPGSPERLRETIRWIDERLRLHRTIKLLEIAKDATARSAVIALRAYFTGGASLTRDALKTLGDIVVSNGLDVRRFLELLIVSDFDAARRHYGKALSLARRGSLRDPAKARRYLVTFFKGETHLQPARNLLDKLDGIRKTWRDDLREWFSTGIFAVEPTGFLGDFAQWLDELRTSSELMAYARERRWYEERMQRELRDPGRMVEGPEPSRQPSGSLNVPRPQLHQERMTIAQERKGAGECPQKGEPVLNPVVPGAVVGVPGAVVGKFCHGTYIPPDSADLRQRDKTHAGVDLVTSCGKRLYAFADGTVVRVTNTENDRKQYSQRPSEHAKPVWETDFENLGYAVAVEHRKELLGKKFYTIYLHMAEPPEVHVGQRVTGGTTPLGKVGERGSASGCHLHFEIRVFDGIRHFYLNHQQWKNIYGSGDRSQSTEFKRNWIDPLLMFSRYPNGISEPSTPMTGTIPSPRPGERGDDRSRELEALRAEMEEAVRRGRDLTERARRSRAGEAAARELRTAESRLRAVQDHARRGDTAGARTALAEARSAMDRAEDALNRALASQTQVAKQLLAVITQERRRVQSLVQEVRQSGASAADKQTLRHWLGGARRSLDQAVKLAQARNVAAARTQLDAAKQTLAAVRQQLERGLALQAQAAQQVLAAIGAERTRWRSLAERVRRAPGGGRAMAHLDGARKDLEAAETNARRGDRTGARNGLGRARLKMNRVGQWLEQVPPIAGPTPSPTPSPVPGPRGTDPRQIQVLQEKFGRMAADLRDLSGRLPGAPAAARSAIGAQLRNAQFHLNRASALLQAGDTSQAPIELGNAGRALNNARQRLKRAAHAPSMRPAPPPTVGPKPPDSDHPLQRELQRMAADLRNLAGRLPGAPATARSAIGVQLRNAQIHLNRASALLQAGDTSQAPIELGNARQALAAARQQLERGLALQAQAAQQVLASIGAERTRWRSLAERARRAPGGGRAMPHLDGARKDLEAAENNARRGDRTGARNGLGRARLKMNMVGQWLDQLDQKASGEGQRLLAEVGRMRADLRELSGRLAGAPAADRQAIEQQLASARTNLNIAEGVARAGGPQVVQARIPLGNARQALAAARRQLK